MAWRYRICIAWHSRSRLTSSLCLDSPSGTWDIAARLGHVGEEISDVLLYSTRLSDLCGIDLSAAISAAALATSADPCNWDNIISEVSKPWGNLQLDALVGQCEQADKGCTLPIVEIRSTIFQILSNLGDVCEVFSREGHHIVEAIPREDRIKLAQSLANIVLLLAQLCARTRLSLSKCVSDKVVKNVQKYPKDIVKGSSAKYTTYLVNKSGSMQFNYLRHTVGVLSVAACVGTVFFFLSRRGGSQ